ncbi:MAG: hypothetical protein K8J31_31560 [Anaerolineae bacterium]|nr:hypothetical protein [Anaerolineae bacterium]
MPPRAADILDQLADLQGLTAAADLDSVIAHLHQPLEHYAELELRSDGRRIDLITLSDQPEVPAHFLDLVQTRGALPPEAAAAAVDLLRFGAGKVVGMKLPLAGPLAGGEVYLRGAIPLAEAAYFLRKNQVEPETLDCLMQIAASFGKNHTHMLAADVASVPGYTVFFTTYLTPESEGRDWEMVGHALEAIGIQAETIASLEPLHALLGANRPATLFFSWAIADGVGRKIAKMDYTGVRVGLVAELMHLVGADESLPITWGRLLHMNRANYAGLIVDAQGLAGARAYFTRRLQILDEGSA